MLFFRLLLVVSVLVPATAAAQEPLPEFPIPWVGPLQESDKTTEPVVAINYQIKWETVAQVVAVANDDRQPVLVLISSSNCYGCRQLEKLLNVQAGTGRFKGWHLAKCEYEKTPKEAQQLMGQVGFLPQLILSKHDGTEWVHSRLVGCPSSADLAAWLSKPVGKSFSIE